MVWFTQLLFLKQMNRKLYILSRQMNELLPFSSSIVRWPGPSITNILKSIFWLNFEILLNLWDECKHLAQVGDHETFLRTESDSSLSLSKNNWASVLPVSSYKAVLKHGRFCWTHSTFTRTLADLTFFWGQQQPLRKSKRHISISPGNYLFISLLDCWFMNWTHRLVVHCRCNICCQFW